MSIDNDDTGVDLTAHLPKVRRTQRRISPAAFSLIIKLMMQGSPTVGEMADQTGLHKNTVRSFVKSFVVNELAYISGWEQDSLGRDCDPRYRWGKGLNMPRKHNRIAERNKVRKVVASQNFRQTGYVHRVQD